jgi:hypothetical protein
MAADLQRRAECPSEEKEIPQDMGGQLPPSPEDESFQITIEKARRLVAMELDLAQTRGQLLESNLKITEAQLELAERQLDQLIAENQHLRQENDALKRRLGESA